MPRHSFVFVVGSTTLISVKFVVRCPSVPFINEIAGKITDVRENVAEKITDVKDNVAEKITDVKDNVAEKITDVREDVKEKITDIKGKIGN